MGEPEERDERTARVRAAFEDGIATQRATLAASAEAIAAAAERVIECFRADHKLLAFGNGGSASDAQHLCAELAGRYVRERPGLPAIALTANTADLTAIGNDYGFERTFARLVETHGRAGDVAVAISTSGNSRNVLEAVAVARQRGIATIGLTGRGGGKLATSVDVPIVVASDRTPRIQETHIAILHAICELVDDALFPEER
ncbi:MAG TPA: SIS domain-containing protein [Myxococcota bacterium]|nr:SIS domain-containing protein [Myxococcota bacterium]